MATQTSKGIPKFRLFIYFLIALAAIGLIIVKANDGRTESAQNNTQTTLSPRGESPAPNTPIQPNTPTEESTNNPIPATLSLDVPFTPQAPTANWDELHGEACEEASAIMVHSYFANAGDVTLDPAYVESEISKLTKWETETYGYYLDITSPEAARMIEENYGLKTEIIQDYSEDDLKQALADGKLVILSVDGRLLNNPNFRQPGPPYHMLVVRGWDEDGFLTNDPGTRKGKSYPYTWETLRNAGAEWVHATHTTDTSQKFAIIVSE